MTSRDHLQPHERKGISSKKNGAKPSSSLSSSSVTTITTTTKKNSSHRNSKKKEDSDDDVVEDLHRHKDMVAESPLKNPLSRNGDEEIRLHSERKHGKESHDKLSHREHEEKKKRKKERSDERESKRDRTDRDRSSRKEHTEKKHERKKVSSDKKHKESRASTERHEMEEKRHHKSKDDSSSRTSKQLAPSHKDSDAKKREKEADLLRKLKAAELEVAEEEDLVVDKEDEGIDLYEDDLEDADYYDDDFESDDNSESNVSTSSLSRKSFKKTSVEGDITDVRHAMDVENNRAASAVAHHRYLDEDESEMRGRSYQSQDDTDHEDSSGDIYDSADDEYERGRHRLDFGAARQQQKDAKQRRLIEKSVIRGKEVLKIVRLEPCTYNLFDLAPMSKYELYIKNFGRSNSEQSYVQTNDENCQIESQTDAIITSVRWTQHPPEDLQGFGIVSDGDNGEVNGSLTVQSVSEREKLSYDSTRLNTFLRQTVPTVLALLEESVPTTVAETRACSAQHEFSNSYIQLLTRFSFLKTRTITAISFSSSTPTLLVIAYGEHAEAHRATPYSLKASGILLLWDLVDPEYPTHILRSASVPISACFSADHAYIVMAGTSDGGVLLWDLRESESLHQASEESTCLRAPSYSTNCLGGDSHNAPVIRVMPIGSFKSGGMASDAVTSLIQVDNTKRDSGETMGKSLNIAASACQMASLDEDGLLIIWVLIEIAKIAPAISETDLGLTPGSRIKLVLAGMIDLHAQSSRLSSSRNFNASVAAFFPVDPSRYLVGTDTGRIIHRSRYGSKAPVPSSYLSSHTSNMIMEMCDRITAIEFSPFEQHIFLVGFTSGHICLYDSKIAIPLVTWTDSEHPIVALHWSLNRPGVFFALNTNSCLLVWNVIKKDNGPILIEKLGDSDDRYNDEREGTSAILFSITLIDNPKNLDEELLDCEDEELEKSVHIAIAYASGVVNVYKLNPKFVRPQRNEHSRFTTYLTNII